jgi:hypothetical protein
MTERVAKERWYLTVNCSYCGEIIPIQKVPSPQEDPYFIYKKATNLVCQLCTHVDTYETSVVRSRKVKSEIDGVLKFE